MPRLLIKEQREIVERAGMFVVKACPGSGKTYTVAARLANRLSTWGSRNRGIAAISFTNVAWQEIRKYLIEDFGVKEQLSYPHFLGTIDSFINQYIFLPFGHLLMGCRGRPRLVGAPINDWEPIGRGNWYWGNYQYNIRGYKLNDFNFTIDGGFDHPFALVRNDPQLVAKIEELKKSVHKVGYATQSDSDYLAMKLLETYPRLCSALSFRFPVVMIDEAQDTTEIQMRIIDLLIGGGLREILLVGDPDQAIFEWNRARPELFSAKFDQWKENSLELNENWRSSQRICNFTFKLSSLSSTSTAADTSVRDYAITPEIWTYPSDEELNTIISKFLDRCKSESIEVIPEKVAVVMRSSTLLGRLLAGTEQKIEAEPWGNHFTRDLARGAFLFQRGFHAEGFRSFERGILKAVAGDRVFSPQEKEDIISQFGFAAWRCLVYKLLAQMPRTETQLLNWITAANETLLKVTAFKEPLTLALKGGRNKNLYANLTFTQIFGPKEARYLGKDYRVGTVHSVKGETFDALLLILKDKTTRKKRYPDLLEAESVSTSEELRIVYVAITRPRKLLVVAVPEKDKAHWAKKFFNGNPEDVTS